MPKSFYGIDSRSEAEKNFEASYFVDKNAFSTYWGLKKLEDGTERLYSETSLGKTIIDKIVTHTIGTGIIPTSSPETSILEWTREEANRFKKEAESFFRLVTNSKHFDFYGRNNWASLQRIALKGILNRGDILLRRLYRKDGEHLPSIQIIGGQWLGGNDVATKYKTLGIILDKEQREIGYELKVTDDSRIWNGDLRRVSKYNRAGFEEYSLVKLQARESNQLRGIPILAAVKSDILNLETFKKSYIAQAIARTFFTLLIERTEQAPQSGDSKTVREIANLSKRGETPRDESVDRDGNFQIGTGNIIQLQNGEHANLIESNIQGQQYSEFIKCSMEEIGAAVGVPYEILLESFQSSFSAARGTIASAKKGFQIITEEFADVFCRPVWEMVIDYGIRMGAIYAPGYMAGTDMEKRAVLAVTWIGPPPAVIDPEKEFTAQKVGIEAGLTTYERAIRTTTGEDFEETVSRLAEEKRMFEELGISLSGDGETSTGDRNEQEN